MNRNRNIIRLAGALALTALVALAPAASAQKQVVLSGTTGGLTWTVYGPSELANLSNQAATLQVSAHPQATVTGAKYDNQTVALTFRVTAPLVTVYNYHDAQLRAQGLTRASQSMAGNNAQAIYVRGDSQVKLTVLRQGNNTYRATFDLSGVQVNVPRKVGITAPASAPASPAPAAPAPASPPPVSPAPISPIPTASAPTTSAPAVVPATAPVPATPAASAPAATPARPVTAAGVTRFTPQENAAAGRNALVRAQDFAGVPYLLYGPVELNSLSSDPSMVSFSLPQGASLTQTDLAASGDLTARITGTSQNLQQVMEFYDRQFKAQGFKLINPTGAGLKNTLTHVYGRGAGSRVSFSVVREADTYRLVWDFQQS